MEPKDTHTTEELVEIAFTGDSRNDSDDVYWKAIYILHKRCTQEVFDAAVNLLGNKEPKKRELGVDILAQLGWDEKPFKEETGDCLLKLMSKEKNPLVLCSIGVAFGHLHDPRGIKPLIKLKNSRYICVRFGVVSGISAHEDEEAINPLIELSADKDEEIRDWATFGLAQQIETDTPEIREAFYDRINDLYLGVRSEALIGLANRKDERVIEPLIEELEIACRDGEWYPTIVDAVLLMPDIHMKSFLECMLEKETSEYNKEEIRTAISACESAAPRE